MPTSPQHVSWSALPREAHAAAVARVREAIAAGETYQVNLTFPLRLHGETRPRELGAQLMERQPTAHGAWLEFGDWLVASASPELFFRLHGDRITMRPMKGTRRRGFHPAEDACLAAELRASAKDQAENVMIVDMVRNDLGRVCAPGSVTVPALFEVERYPTVWQMTSTVEGRTRAGLPDLFAALFPCASVTGAPKASTMRLIRDLEIGPRGVYTGAIGVLQPGRRYEFNVAIRTLQAQLSENQVRYDVGSGVVWDSQADTEYAECLQKAEALRPPPPRPALLETMLYQPGKGVWLLEHHLKRLRETALFMGYADPSTRAEQLLRALDHGQEMRVRLVYDPNAHLHEAHGDPFDLHCAPLSELRPPAGQPLRIRLDTEATPSSVRLLYIKTTSRGVYDTARARHPDVDDVLLWNERGELTESTIANLALCIDGRWITPRVSCGLLAGCYRAELLEQGWMSEGILTRDDLARASEILLLNSVRGKIAVTWVP